MVQRKILQSCENNSKREIECSEGEVSVSNKRQRVQPESEIEGESKTSQVTVVRNHMRDSIMHKREVRERKSRREKNGKIQLKEDSRSASYWREKFSEMAENYSKKLNVKGAEAHVARIEKGRLLGNLCQSMQRTG